MERQEIEWSREVESKQIVSENDHRYATFGHPLEKCHKLDAKNEKCSSFFTRNIYDSVAGIVEYSWNNG